jgi:hypothetical protein
MEIGLIVCLYLSNNHWERLSTQMKSSNDFRKDELDRKHFGQKDM